MTMNISYTDDGGILLVGEGIVTGKEIIDINDRIYISPQKIQQILYQLVDFTKVTELLVSNAEVEILAMQDENASKINPNMSIALVGGQDLVYGLARMWKTLTYGAPIQTMVFRKLEDAQQWIKDTIQKVVRTTV